MTPDTILTDPELRRAYDALIASIKSLLKPEEIDRLLHAYQVQQIKNQYEYILAITQVRHEARLFVLQAQLNLRKLDAQALLIVTGATRIEEMIAHGRDDVHDIIKKYAKKVSNDLQHVEDLPDTKIRESTRQSFINSFLHWLNSINKRSDATADKIAQLLTKL